MLSLACSSGLTLVEREGLGDPAAVLQAQHAQGDKLQRLRLYGDMDLRSPAVVRKGAFVLLFDRSTPVDQPGALRFEALSANDLSLMLLVVSGERFMSYDRASNRCYTGPWNETTSLGGLSLGGDVDELFALFAGTIARGAPGAKEAEPVASGTKLWWAPKEERVVLEVPWKGRRWFHRLSKDGQRVEATEVRPGSDGSRDSVHNPKGSAPMLRADYSEFGAVDGQVLPAALRLSIPADDSQTSVRVRRAAVNPVFPGGAFSLDCPKGSTEGQGEAGVSQ